VNPTEERRLGSATSTYIGIVADWPRWSVIVRRTVKFPGVA